MHPNNPRLMDAQLASYLKRFAENMSDERRTELAMAFYAGAISLQRVEEQMSRAIQSGREQDAALIGGMIAEEIAETANRLLTGRIVPGENVKPL